MTASRDPDPWTRRAGLYRLQLPLERPALRALLAMLDLGESDSLLDLGTGTAALLHQVARSARRPRSAIGVDRSQAMLARAPSLPPGWRLIEADAGALPFPDASFDVVTAAYLLHLLDGEARARVINESRRVVGPGGRVGVVTVASPAGRRSPLTSRPVRALAERSGGVLRGLRPLDPREQLAAAGLRPVCVRWVRVGYPSLCVVAERVD